MWIIWDEWSLYIFDNDIILSLFKRLFSVFDTKYFIAAQHGDLLEIVFV